MANASNTVLNKYEGGHLKLNLPVPNHFSSEIPKMTTITLAIFYLITSDFNSDSHYIYYCVQESPRRNILPLRVNKRVGNAVLGYNLKNYRMSSVPFQGKAFNITVTQPLMLNKLKLNSSIMTYKTF